MRLLAGLIIAVLFTMLFRVPLRKMPPVFYTLALLLDVLLIACDYMQVPSWFREYFLFLFQSNTLAMGMFTIVMFTGALSDHTALKKTLMGIRAELSIVASILCMGHIVKYGESYFDQALSSLFIMPTVRLGATFIALVLVLLLIPLAITSVKRIRAAMSPRGWQKLQKFAYLFYGLIFIHIMFYLMPSALGGGLTAAVSVAAYVVLGLLYAVLRIRQYTISQNVPETRAIPLRGK
jgi:DMSO/TMAO reductase YedYZ heme-binding membrane subunit